MNVYDFDKTIFDGDSTMCFVKEIFLNYPKAWILFPTILKNGVLFLLSVISKKQFKQSVFRCFRYIDNRDDFLREFVEKHISRIKSWYFEQQKDDDVIITASPEFLVKSFAEKINIKTVLGSPVSYIDGTYSGENCHGQEKVHRFYLAFPNGQINQFYSDSRTDEPLAKISQYPFIVRKDERKPW